MLKFDNRYMWTATGQRIYFDKPRLKDFYLEDIAVGLSRIPRFNGQFKPYIDFYSVAEHSVVVYKLVKERFPHKKLLLLHALMHDSPEAYLNDIISPMKHTAAFKAVYEALETRFMRCIAKRLSFSVNARIRKKIKVYDNIMQQTEIAYIMHLPPDELWKPTGELRPDLLQCLSPNQAYEQFLDAYWEIMSL